MVLIKILKCSVHHFGRQRGACQLVYLSHSNLGTARIQILSNCVEFCRTWTKGVTKSKYNLFLNFDL